MFIPLPFCDELFDISSLRDKGFIPIHGCRAIFPWMGDPLDEVKQHGSKDVWRNTHLYGTQGAEREESAKESYAFQMHGSK